MERPFGVTILGVLSIAFGIVVGLIGVLALGWGLLVSRSSVDSWGLNKFFAVGGAIIAVICFAFAAVYAVIGRGMLKLQGWARIVLIVFAALGLLSSPAGLMNLSVHTPVSLAVRLVVGVSLDIWVLIYLFRPHVRQAFGVDGF